MKKLLVHVFLVLIIFILNFSVSKAAEKVPFPFTVDDKVDANEVISFDDIKNSDEIKNNEYWNKPFTKFDYILTQMKKRADESMDYIKSGFEEYSHFEKVVHKKKYDSVEIKVENAVHFNEIYGKIIVMFTVSNLGRAKSPMSETCKSTIELIVSGIIPQKNEYHYMNNYFLNQLYRHGHGYEYYDDYLNIIAKNTVLLLRLNSIDSEKKHWFTMTCKKNGPNAKFTINKYSNKLN